MITENLSTLKINKLTQSQYDRELEAGNIDENALYLTPEEEIDLSGYATKEEVNNKANKEHYHTRITNTMGEGDRSVVLMYDSLVGESGEYFLRPDTSDGDVWLGGENFPWRKIITNALDIAGVPVLPWRVVQENGGRYATLVMASGIPYFRPDTTNKDMNLGGTSFRWNNVYCVTNNESSDERLKENFDTNMDKYIEMLDLLEPTSYNFKDEKDGKRNVGYIAQRVEEAMECVGLATEDFGGLNFDPEEKEGEYSYGLAYSQFIPILHAKIKKQDEEIVELKERIVKLESLIK